MFSCVNKIKFMHIFLIVKLHPINPFNKNKKVRKFQYESNL